MIENEALALDQLSHCGWMARLVLVVALVFGLEIAVGLVVCFSAKAFLITHWGEAAPSDIRIDGAAAPHPQLESWTQIACRRCSLNRMLSTT